MTQSTAIPATWEKTNVPHIRALSGSRGAWLSYAIVLGTVVAAYAPFVGAYFTTTDVWPLLDSSRVASLADVLRLFTQPIMAGSSFAAAVGAHYRPLVSLSFAVDFALWGLDPFGYSLTNFLLHVLNALLVLRLARRLGLERWSSTVAALVFALHPVMASAVPAVARRQDALAGLFLFSSLLLLPRASTTWSLRFFLRLAFAAGAFFLALLAKEVALAALPVVAIFGMADGASSRISLTWPDVKKAAPVCVAFGVVTVAALLLRFAVLRGLGGYFESAGAIGEISAEAYGRVFSSFVGFLLWPVPGLESFTFPLGMLLGVGLAQSLPRWRRGVVPLVVGAVWLCCFCLFYMVLKLLGASAWYMYLPLAGWGIALAAVLQACAPKVGSLARGGALNLGTRGELGTTILFICVAVLLAGTVWWSPLITRYPSWTDGADVVQVFVQGAQECFRKVPDGAQVRLDDVPSGVAYADRGSKIAGVTLLDDYSVQALANLVAGEKRLRVHLDSGALMRGPSPGAHVECVSARDGWHLRTVGLR